MVTKTIGINTGDYQCTGSNDSATIQAAFDFAAANKWTTLQFLPGVFEINQPVLGCGDVVVAGTGSSDGGWQTTLRIKNECGWTNTLSATAMLMFNNKRNIEIFGIKFDGNSTNQTYISRPPYNYNPIWGRGFHQGVYLPYSQHIKIHDCYFTNSLGDGVRGAGNTNFVEFYNNKADTLGHEVLFMSGGTTGCHDISAHHNDMVMRADGALRADDSWNVKFFSNVITCQGNGNPGIQIGDHYGACSNIEIFDNVISNTPGPGVWLNDLSQSVVDKGVYIHDNIISNCGLHTNMNYNCGILVNRFNGTYIQNNTINNCRNAGVLVFNPYGTQGETTISIEGNTITGTLETGASGNNRKEWTGCAVVNGEPGVAVVYERGNTFENNVNGNVWGEIVSLPGEGTEPDEPGMPGEEDPIPGEPDAGDEGQETLVVVGQLCCLIPKKTSTGEKYALVGLVPAKAGEKGIIWPTHSQQYYVVRAADTPVIGKRYILATTKNGEQFLLETYEIDMVTATE